MFASVKTAMEIAAHQHDDNHRQIARKPTARARVSNGRDVLPNVDGRSLVARRYRDISNAIIVDQGGADQCSESRLQLIRRFAAAAVLAEQLESKLANGEEIDIAQHGALASTLVRLAAKIGIDRRAKDIGGLTLGDLMRADIEERRREADEASKNDPVRRIAGEIEERVGGLAKPAEGHVSDEGGTP